MATSKNIKKQKIPIKFSIKSIDLTEKYCNFPESKNDFVLEKLKYEIIAKIEPNKEDSYINILVNYNFFDEINEYLKISVLNKFFVSDLAKLFDKENKFLDVGFIRYLADMSIGHARGIHSTIIKNTTLENLYIPPVSHNNIDSKIVW